MTEKIPKKHLVMQAKILVGHIKPTASILMQKEVLSIMNQDDVSEIAQNDPLLMMLRESWLRRNVANLEKRKYYAS